MSLPHVAFSWNMHLKKEKKKRELFQARPKEASQAGLLCVIRLGLSDLYPFLSFLDSSPDCRHTIHRLLCGEVRNHSFLQNKP